MDENGTRQAREQVVVKRNDLIQKTRHEYTLQEQRAMQYVISLVKPGDTSFCEYVIRISDFLDICGIYDKGGKAHQELKDTLKKMADKSYWYMLPDGKETLIRWFTHVTINHQEGTFALKLHEDLVPYLVQLKNNYTQYELKYILAMRSRYSMRLYEILKSNVYKGTPITFELGNLKKIIDAETHKTYNNFQRKVLDYAKAEICELTDITFEYEQVKTGRKVTALTFHIAQKADLGERLDAWTAIENRLARKKARKNPQAAET